MQGVAYVLLYALAARCLCAKASQAVMSLRRMFSAVCVLSVVIAGFLPLAGCADEDALLQRCAPSLTGKSCQARLPNDMAGDSGMLARDGGGLDASAPAAETDSRRSELQDAGAARPDEFPKTPQCAAPARFFSPACASWSIDPENFPARITPGCYRPCTRPRDATCGSGSRCGRASIAPLLCSGSTCTSICAEVWLCLPHSLFQPALREDDAGAASWTDYDAGL
jgi:hypothetical protein